MLSKLEAFRRQIAKRITGRAPLYLRRKEQWEYSSLGDVVEEAGLLSISEYIAPRNTRIAEFVATSPLFVICKELKGLG
jgi:hypothetical protein